MCIHIIPQLLHPLVHTHHWHWHWCALQFRIAALPLQETLGSSVRLVFLLTLAENVVLCVSDNGIYSQKSLWLAVVVVAIAC